MFYETCLYAPECGPFQRRSCDASLTIALQHQWDALLPSVTALTCDHAICKATEKVDLGKRYCAQVVDMEGYAVLDGLSDRGISVAMLRVVSDDCNGDLPNLEVAFDRNGQLLPWPLAGAMLSRPRAALELVRGALRGLAILERAISRTIGAFDNG